MQKSNKKVEFLEHDFNIQKVPIKANNWKNIQKASKINKWKAD